MDFVHFAHREDIFGMLFKIFSYQFIIPKYSGNTHICSCTLWYKEKKMEKAEATLPYIEINHNSLYLFCTYFYPLMYVRYNFKKFFVRNFKLWVQFLYRYWNIQISYFKELGLVSFIFSYCFPKFYFIDLLLIPPFHFDLM